MKRREPPEVCPVCGEDVPRSAQACPECGACYESGWKESARLYDDADIPEHGYEDDEKFDYDRWRDREEGRGRVPGEIHPLWKWVAAGLLSGMVYLCYVLWRR